MGAGQMENCILVFSVLETVHWSLGGAAAYRGAVVGPTVHVGGQMIGQCV